MNDTVIKTIQLTKKYGNQTVVNKANLHVNKVGFTDYWGAMVPVKQR